MAKIFGIVATAPNGPKEALEWIYEVTKANTIDALEGSGSGQHGSWEALDTALSGALNIPKHGEAERQMKSLENNFKHNRLDQFC